MCGEQSRARPETAEDFDYGFDDVTGTFTNPGAYGQPEAR